MASIINRTAIVDRSATIGDNCSIGAYAEIGPDVTIGNSTYVGSYCNIEAGVTIGAHCEIQGRVIGEGSTFADQAHSRFETVPPGSYIESTSKYGCGYFTTVMYCLDSDILVKPGCLPAEPIAATRARLERIRDKVGRTPAVSWAPTMYPPGFTKSTTRQAEAARMLEWFDMIESFHVELV